MEGKSFFEKLDRLILGDPKMAYVSPESPLSTPADWVQYLFNEGSVGPVAVNERTAIQNSTVYACVSVISQTIASLPCGVVRSEGDLRVPDPTHPVHSILSAAPNPWMTPIVFWELVFSQILLTGNHYSIITRNRGGRSVQLSPLDNPRAVSVERVDGRLKYTVSLRDGGEEFYDQSQVVHIPGLGFDGLMGLSVISYAARQAVALALTAELQGTEFLSRGAKVSGVLKHPARLTDEKAIKRLRDQWHSMYGSGGEKAGGTVILEEGMDFEPVQMTAEEAQFLETRRFGVEEISRFFRVPLHLINETTKNTSWGTGLEQNNISFVTYTLTPWMVRAEQEINRKLLGRPEEAVQAKFNTNALLRGDNASRADFYGKMIINAGMTPNEIRAKEDLPPLPGGNQLFIQRNLVPIDQAGDESGEGNGNTRPFEEDEAPGAAAGI